MSVWERFNEIEGADANAVEEAISQFEPIEAGQYKVRLEGIEASESRSGLPMVKGKFRVLEGEQSNRLIFYNQVIQNLNYPNITALNISKVMNLVGGILGEKVEFKGLVALEKLLTSIDEGIEFTIELRYDTKDTEKSFPQITVVKELEVLAENISSEDVPF